jgi:hypothetical protein
MKFPDEKIYLRHDGYVQDSSGEVLGQIKWHDVGGISTFLPMGELLAAVELEAIARKMREMEGERNGTRKSRPKNSI